MPKRRAAAEGSASASAPEAAPKRQRSTRNSGGNSAADAAAAAGGAVPTPHDHFVCLLELPLEHFARTALLAARREQRRCRGDELQRTQRAEVCLCGGVPRVEPRVVVRTADLPASLLAAIGLTLWLMAPRLVDGGDGWTCFCRFTLPALSPTRTSSPAILKLTNSMATMTTMFVSCLVPLTSCWTCVCV